MQDSIWFRTLTDDERKPFERTDELPRSSEVVIVGAGMVGLATAYYLAQAGLKDICIVDRGTALGEASGANAGGLWFAQESIEPGPVAELNKVASQLYDRLGEEFAFDLRRPGMLELLYSQDDIEKAPSRVERVRAAGFRAEQLDRDQMRALEPTLGAAADAALHYPDEGHLHPAKLASALIQSLRGRGVRVCSGVEVDDISAGVVTSQGPIATQTIIVTAGSWTPLLTRTLGWEPPIRPIRGTLLAVGPLEKMLTHTITARQFYFTQLASGYIVGGGSLDDVGFRRGVDPNTTARIRAEMTELIPATSELATFCAWSGFRPYCDGMKPVIGKVPGRERMFVAAGHYRKGIMQSPVTGKIVADLVTKGSTELPADAFRPDRFPLAPAT
ncbi:MAG: FAD-dependent oxidoreductase [Acidobacteria bacterium]|nr:FAD-dependent oxidoreductase [Acidobacteriota bacterium]